MLKCQAVRPGPMWGGGIGEFVQVQPYEQGRQIYTGSPDSIPSGEGVI